MSSYFDDASLVMIPSGYKTSKVYSVKPTDGSGDLTFSRSNDTATRVNSAGLIEKVRTNRALYSEDFTNAAWTNLSITVGANATTAPNGTTTADKITPTTSNTVHLIHTNVITSAGEYSFSVYVKAAGYSKVALRESQSVGFYASFDLTSGTIIDSSANQTNTITSVGNGWYRITSTRSYSGTINLGLVPLPNSYTSGDPLFAYAGDGTSGIFAWGAQMEFDVPTAYIATTSAAVSVGPVANVPRLDYLNSSCPRLLLEPQRTNLSTFSEQFNNTAWFKETGNSVTANTIASPDGYTNADTTTATSTNAININQSHTSASSSVHTFSIFLKKNNLSEIQVYIFSAGFLARANVNLDNGTITDINGSGATITNYGNGWYRCSVQATINTGVGFTIGYLSVSTTGSRSVYTYGAQLEVGAYATSYIPTLGAAVTRGEEICNKTSITSLIGQTEGTLYAEFYWDGNPVENWIASVQTSLSNFVAMFLLDDGRPYFYILNSGSPQMAYIGTALSVGYHKMAFGYAANNSVAYVDGVLKNTDTSCTIPATSEFRTGSVVSSHTQTAKINEILVFKTRLSNADLAALTTI